MNDFRPAGGGSGGAPSGAAGGSLTGTYPNPTIATIPSGATATTQAAADASTKLATTAYTDTGLALKANLASPTFTGTPLSTTAAADTNTTQVATTAYVVGQAYAKLASPTFSGTPSLPTGTTGTTQTTPDNSTKLATTAYVDQYYEAVRQTMEMTARGFKAWTGPLFSGWSTNSPASQTEVAAKVFLPYNMSITGCVIIVSTPGSSLTSGQCLVTLYNQAGTKQGSTADQSAVWTSAGAYNAAFSGGPYALTGGSAAYCWVSILCNGTTPATFRCHGSAATTGNISSTGALTGASLMNGRVGTTVTAPATFTPGNLVTTSAAPYFIALY